MLKELMTFIVLIMIILYKAQFCTTRHFYLERLLKKLSYHYKSQKKGAVQKRKSHNDVLQDGSVPPGGNEYLNTAGSPKTHTGVTKLPALKERNT